jgi:hypothetical protein
MSRKPEAKHRKTWQGGYKATRARHVAELKEIVAKIKDVPCADCGVKYPPPVMEFDHRVPEDKVLPVATMVSTCYSLDAVLKEIEKCDLVCANCHRMRHMPTSTAGK